MGDKTQIANLSLSAKSGSFLSIFLASVTAFAVVTLITVSLGGILGKFIRPDYVRVSAASLFIIVGLLMFFNKI
ncbi:MAG: TMEM165/GDT1 family protein [Candidatus Omnitrophica bacterium]|nr:TMEM165/GDT1 family protein [Candidatus Omnitrophota bacterium]MBU1872078.1 TMEM165/GDT1 family protein [Candidatus Omnitrophota bacterium]